MARNAFSSSSVFGTHSWTITDGATISTIVHAFGRESDRCPSCETFMWEGYPKGVLGGRKHV